MFDGFIEIAASYGIWTAMFLGLLVYLLADSRKREIKYQQTVEKLADRLAAVHEIREDIKEIKLGQQRSKRAGGKNEKKDSQKEFLAKPCGVGDLAAAAAGCES